MSGPGGASAAASLDAALEELHRRSMAWARLEIEARVRLLDGLLPRIAAVADEWVDLSCDAKGIPHGAAARGEEWASGPYAVLRYVRALRETTRAVARGRPERLLEGRLRARHDGQVVARVMPFDPFDRVLLSGIRADVWMEQGVTAADVGGGMATFLRSADPPPRVALVLGAGNISAIPPLDVLYRLYGDGDVCLLKMNPVNDYLGPVLERAFAEFVGQGFLRIAYGGVETGVYLTRHARVGAIHVTGSAATHDAIVFGTGEAGRRRKARDEPEIDIPVTSELGGVSPIVVVPGPWSRADLRFQAENIATMKLVNLGYTCLAGQVVVLPRDWPSGEVLLDEVRRVIRSRPARPPYYPGSADRMDEACAAYPEVEDLGHDRLLIPDVPGGELEHALTSEFFGPALAATRIAAAGSGPDAATYLNAAVDLCNERIFGSLSMNILVHPATMRSLGARFEDALARLRYGTVAVNAWSAVGFLTPGVAWGAFPGHRRNDIQSGTGFVHNAFLFDRPRRSIVQGPFAPFPRSMAVGERHLAPKPPWFITHAGSETVFRRLAYFEADPTVRRLPGVVAAALRG